MQVLLRVTDLNVIYHGAGSRQHHAVQSVSFEMGEGEVLGLMGESGCGKTSVALALPGLLSQAQAQVSGSIQFRGNELLSTNHSSLRAIRGAGISLVFQEPELALSPVMKIRDQVAEVIHAHNDWNWQRCRAEAESEIKRWEALTPGRPDYERAKDVLPHLKLELEEAAAIHRSAE